AVAILIDIPLKGSLGRIATKLMDAAVSYKRSVAAFLLILFIAILGIIKWSPVKSHGISNVVVLFSMNATENGIRDFSEAISVGQNGERRLNPAIRQLNPLSVQDRTMLVIDFESNATGEAKERVKERAL